MSNDSTRILEMLAAKKITPQDADQLLRAIERPRPGWWRWLFAPLERLETPVVLAISGGVALAQLLVSRLGIRFDGTLDVHVGTGLPWWQGLVDLILAWPISALVCWGVVRLVTRRCRFVDFLGAVGLARIPLVAAGLLAWVFREPLLDAIRLGASTGEVDPGVVAFSLLSVPLTVWFVTLLITGIRTASGLRGAKLAFTSLGAIAAAETVTKLLLLAL